MLSTYPTKNLEWFFVSTDPQAYTISLTQSLTRKSWMRNQNIIWPELTQRMSTLPCSPNSTRTLLSLPTLAEMMCSSVILECTNWSRCSGLFRLKGKVLIFLKFSKITLNEMQSMEAYMDTTTLILNQATLTTLIDSMLSPLKFLVKLEFTLWICTLLRSKWSPSLSLKAN